MSGVNTEIQLTTQLTVVAALQRSASWGWKARRRGDEGKEEDLQGTGCLILDAHSLVYLVSFMKPPKFGAMDPQIKICCNRGLGRRERNLGSETLKC